MALSHLFEMQDVCSCKLSQNEGVREVEVRGQVEDKTTNFEEAKGGVGAVQANSRRDAYSCAFS